MKKQAIKRTKPKIRTQKADLNLAKRLEDDKKRARFTLEVISETRESINYLLDLLEGITKIGLGASGAAKAKKSTKAKKS